MKTRIIGKRRALQEKKLYGCVQAIKCYICSRTSTLDMQDQISGVKYAYIGTKYIEGVEYMLVDGKLETSTYLYTDEHTNTEYCTCVVPAQRCAPIGTVFSLYKPFASVQSRNTQIFAPVFTEYSQYKIVIDRIMSKEDTRTTCMVKNIPNKLSTRQLVLVLSRVCYNAFDFVYLRMDFKSCCNNGYAFVNFRNAQYIPIFVDALQGKRWQTFRSEKKAEIAYARIQGMAMLQNRFRRSDILAASREYWPVVFDSEGNEIPATDWGRVGSIHNSKGGKYA